MKSIITNVIAIVLVVLSCCELTAQDAAFTSKVLEQYIKSGLSNNLSLQQKEFSLHKSDLALQEARSYFMPSIAFQTDYSLAEGGRKIDLPLGDLFNNAYASLNKLTSSNDFSMVNNQKIPLIPTVFQDTRITAMMPLVNQELKYITQLQKEVIQATNAEVNVYKRELIRDIRAAYYHYVQSLKVINIYKNASQLLLDNIKYTEVLLKNSKGLRSDLLKIQAQVSNNAALLAEAENRSKSAATYFNFLINAPLDAPVITDSSMYAAIHLANVEPNTSTFTNREELEVIRRFHLQTLLLGKKERATKLPQINAFVNAGIQGRNYKLNSEQAYVVGGVQLKWTIYNGAKTSARIKQIRKDSEILQMKLEETTNQLEVELINKRLEFKTGLAKCKASEKNYQFALEIYRETQLRYRQGLALSIELQDSFTRLINSQVELELNQADLFLKMAEIERTTAAYLL